MNTIKNILVALFVLTAIFGTYVGVIVDLNSEGGDLAKRLIAGEESEEIKTHVEIDSEDENVRYVYLD